MNKVAEFYLVVVAIFIVSFSNNSIEGFSIEIEEFSLEIDEFLNG